MSPLQMVALTLTLVASGAAATALLLALGATSLADPTANAVASWRTPKPPPPKPPQVPSHFSALVRREREAWSSDTDWDRLVKRLGHLGDLDAELDAPPWFDHHWLDARISLLEEQRRPYPNATPTEQP